MHYPFFIIVYDDKFDAIDHYVVVIAEAGYQPACIAGEPDLPAGKAVRLSPDKVLEKHVFSGTMVGQEEAKKFIAGWWRAATSEINFGEAPTPSRGLGDETIEAISNMTDEEIAKMVADAKHSIQCSGTHCVCGRLKDNHHVA